MSLNELIDPLLPLVPDVCNAIGAKKSKAYEEIAAGRLSVVKNGKRVFVRASEARRYIDALPVSTGPILPKSRSQHAS